MGPERDETDQAELAQLLDLATAGPGGPKARSENRDEADEALVRLSRDIPSPSPLLRGLIIVIAVAQLVLVIPWLIGLDPFGLLDHGDDGHLTRDGSFGLVVAVAGLLTAWRPRWALPSLLISVSALVAQGLAVLIDDTGAGFDSAELIHGPSIVLLALISLAVIRLSPLGPHKRKLRTIPGESVPPR